jgi:hypothetical protein
MAFGSWLLLCDAQQVRSRIIEVVSAGQGVLEVCLSAKAYTVSYLAVYDTIRSDFVRV